MADKCGVMSRFGFDLPRRVDEEIASCYTYDMYT